ncbi:YqcI/YcgG family protein [Acetobacteraceae bacterium B3987]|nr:YqcI/YcgG family protein [Acetobacteraceae bacterium B3987]
MRIWDKNEIQDCLASSWERVSYDEFSKVFMERERIFPCTLGVAGFNNNQIRFGFISDDIDSVKAGENLAAMLQSYLPYARKFGKNTSLVVFFNEERELGIENYERIFWDLLKRISFFDVKAWPENVPKTPDDHLWEFSFAGEPVFVVCNTPSHRVRRSRYSKNFMITFQPRWVFEGIIGEGAPNSEKIKREIRRKLVLFDGVLPSPDLGAYGDKSNFEWKQYFLKENNDPRSEKCPFTYKGRNNLVEVISTDLTVLDDVVSQLLPPTGSVEVQYDSPFRVHEQHHHNVDETLHIICGEITFYYGEHNVTCRAGDRLLLPAMTLHKSRAGDHGCLYVIATRIIRPEIGG